jgi:twinkle protein
MKKSHLPCPKCSSSDAYSIDDNGWGKCFSCNVNIPPEKASKGYMNNIPVEIEKPKKPLTAIAEVFRPLKTRGFTEETVKKYLVNVGDEDTPYIAKYPLFSVTGEHVANKVRMSDKTFPSEGNAKRESNLGLFGRHSFEPNPKLTVTVTEGQDDAMAAYQLTGSKYPCVSVHSATTAKEDIKRDFEYLNSFDTIVLCFDNDEAGKKAVKEVSSLPFKAGKLRILTLKKYKDANDYLLAKDAAGFTQEWWNAPRYHPDGLVLGTDLWDQIIDRKDSFCVPYPFPNLNKLTYGLRLSELVVFTADTGVGKTSVLKHIEHSLLTNPEVIEKGYGVGFLHLEEPNGDTALGLLSIHNNVPYHLPDVERPEADLRRAYNEVLNNNRVVVWDHFGSNSVDAVLDKIRHMAALGCKYIVIDHLSIIVSDQSGDERKQLDEITTKIKTMTMELDLSVIAVIHTNRQGQIRGTAGVEQLANIVIRLERDKTDPNEWRRNITKMSVDKNRFCGYTGPASYVWYNKETARLSELSAEDALIYENGGTLRDDQQGF